MIEHETFLLQIPAAEKQRLLDEAIAADLCLNTYLTQILTTHTRIDLSSVPVVHAMRAAFLDDLAAVYRLLDHPGEGWRGVVVLTADCARTTRSINRTLRDFHAAHPAARVAVRRLPLSTPERDEAWRAWFEFVTHAFPVYVRDLRAPIFLREVRLRLAAGEWRRSGVAGGWVKMGAPPEKSERPAAVGYRAFFGIDGV